MEKKVSHTAKAITITLFFLLTGYYGHYIYQTIPSQMGFSLRWNTTSNQLMIASVHPDLEDALQAGDVITAINDMQVTRRSVLPTPKTIEYKLELIRDGVSLERTITPIDGQSRIFTELYASITMLIIGSVMMIIGNRWSDMMPAVVFMLTAVGWLCIAAFQFGGEAFAWIIGYTAVPIMGPLYTQLGYSVKPQNERRIMPNWVMGWLVVSVIWGVIGGFEYLFLFPQGQSIHALYNVEWLAVSYLSVGVGLFLSVIVILFRAVKLPPSYTKRQLVILVLFVTVGVLPFVFLTVMPRVFTGMGQLPGTVGFALLLFLPLGFLFVVLRRQHLFIEMTTSRILTAVLLTVTFIILFSVIRLNLIHKGFEIPLEASVIVVGIGLLGIYPNSALLKGMRILLYGKSQLTQKDMQQIARQVTQQPNWKTVDQILEKVAQALELENIALYEWNDVSYERTACGYPVQADIIFPDDIQPSTVFPKSIIRVSDIAEIKGLFSDSDRAVYIPIMTADLLAGFLIASAGSTLEQLNERDLVQLRQLGDTLAIALPAINLFETINSGQTVSIYTRAVERQELSAKIHDGPLQELLILGRELGQRTRVNEIAQSLRQICDNLYNPILDDQVEYIAKDLIYPFETADEYEIHLIIRPNVPQVEVAEKAKLAFYYIVKEAIANITKHTNAKNIVVELDAHQSQFEVTISDDGGGSIEKVLPKRRKGKHHGMNNMRYWASIADGEIVIDKRSSIGWTVHLTLPTTNIIEEQEEMQNEQIDEVLQ